MRFNPLYKLIFSIFLFFLLLPFNSCKKDQEYIPYVPVSLSFDLSVRNDLTVTSSSTLFDQHGNGGIILFCEFYDVVSPSQSIYYAYDATCTYEVEDSCSVKIDGGSVTAICPCCGSEYSLFDGWPYKGEASKSLKYYNVSVINDMLRIYN